MRNLRTLLLIAVFTLGIGGAVNAQKVAHIDYSKLILEMPAFKALSSDMEKLQKTYQSELESMEKKFIEKQNKYEAEAQTQTEITNKTRSQELKQDSDRLQQYLQEARLETQRKQGEKIKPILEKAKKAIEEVAASKGILYVFDSSEGKGLLVKKGEDLYAAVKAKLGF